jgi:hypothetical protein
LRGFAPPTPNHRLDPRQLRAERVAQALKASMLTNIMPILSRRSAAIRHNIAQFCQAGCGNTLEEAFDCAAGDIFTVVLLAQQWMVRSTKLGAPLSLDCW